MSDGPVTGGQMSRRCPHIAASHARRWPCAPCDLCRAFIDDDQTLMSADIALERYPGLWWVIEPKAREWRALQRSQRPAAQIGRAVGNLAMLIRTLALAVIALCLLYLLWALILR